MRGPEQRFGRPASSSGKHGADRVTADPIEAGYVYVWLWAKSVEKAGSTHPDKSQI